MKEIVEYTDYRKFIQDYYDERKRTSAFTWRDFARDAGFSSAVYLKYVCEGKKNLSVGAAGSVASAMGLVGFEHTYFVLMVSYAHAKGDAAKRAAFEERCALANAHKVRVLGDEEFKYFKSWKNVVLRELAPHMPGAKPLEMAKACKQPITAAEVSQTLDFLVRAKLLKKDKDGNYHQTDKAISMGSVDAVPVAARDLQRQMAEFAVKAGNPMMADEIRSAQDRILNFIRERFGNPAITMEIVVDQSRNVEHLLTREEQYAKMKASNPALAELETVFGLELR